MFKLEILNHWIVPQQGKNHSEIDEEPNFLWPNNPCNGLFTEVSETA